MEIREKRKAISKSRKNLSLIACHLLPAFSLVELLIVIAIFGLTISLVTAAFLTFERNQVIRNAALQLKSDLRQAQNKALSGDKGSGSSICDSSSTLGGWYIQISTDVTNGDNGKYTIAGDCRSGSSDSVFSSKTVSLPSGVTVLSTSLGNVTSANILYQPLVSGVSVHNGSLTPPFFDSSGNLLNQVSVDTPLVITLAGSSGNTYQVVVSPSGGINEVKP